MYITFTIVADTFVQISAHTRHNPSHNRWRQITQEEKLLLFNYEAKHPGILNPHEATYYQSFTVIRS